MKKAPPRITTGWVSALLQRLGDQPIQALGRALVARGVWSDEPRTDAQIVDRLARELGL